MDGPNTNKNVKRRVNELLIKLRGKGLLNVGDCNLHVINNSFHRGLEIYGNDVSDVIVQVYNWFDGFPARLEAFQNYCQDKKYTYKTITKHVPSRWLTLGPAAERFRELFIPLKNFFLTFLPSQKNFKSSKHHINILNYLKKNNFELELLLVLESSNLFSGFLTIFQSSNPMIHLLYSKITELIRLIASKVCVTITEEIDSALFDDENIKLSSKIELSNTMDDKIKQLKLQEVDRLMFINNYKKHYVAAGKYVVSKIYNSLDILKAFQILNPKTISGENSLKYLKTLTKCFPFTANVEEKVIDEFKLLQFEKVEYNDERIDEFWVTIFKKYEYKNLEFFIKSILSTSHGQADVERRFSCSGNILQDESSNMTIRTLNARLNSVDGIMQFRKNVESIPITKEFLNMASSAWKSYNNFLEEERAKKQKLTEDKKRKDEEEEKKRKDNEKTLKRMQDLNAELKAIESQLKESEDKFKENQKLTDAMLKEASEKFKKCLQKNDLIGAKVAETILNSANENRLKEKDEQYEIAKLRKKRNDIFEKLSHKNKK